MKTVPNKSSDLDGVLAFLAVELLGWCPSQDTTGWFYDPKRQDFAPTGVRYLITGNGMLEIIEAMQRPGFVCAVLSEPATDFRWKCSFFTRDFQIYKAFREDSLPEAVALAAHAALTNQDAEK